MTGLSRHSARQLDAEAHLAQSIADILSTPIGSRVMRRDYGSGLPDLIDAPMNGETIVDVYYAAAEAIDKWEPRFALTRVQVASAAPGKLELIVVGDVDHAAIEIPVTLGAAA